MLIGQWFKANASVYQRHLAKGSEIRHEYASEIALAVDPDSPRGVCEDRWSALDDR